MAETIANPAAEQTGWRKTLILGAIVLVLLLAAVFAYQAWRARQTGEAPPGSESLSVAELEEQYGLRVRLIGVTAGGGMIDFRLKILDAEKARQFLQDPASLPISMVTENGTELLAADVMDKDLIWEEGGILFILLPNSGGAVQPGMPVTIHFGGVQLEPISAQ